MSLTSDTMTPADIAAVCGNNNRNNDGMFGNDWAWIVILLLFGWGGRGFGGFGGFGGGNGGGNCCNPCATQADLAAGFNNSAVLSNLNDLALGQAGIQQTLCQGFNGVNTTVLQGFNGVDNAICNLGYNVQSGFNGVTRQISDCCCDLEKANMQNRFDAQAYNANTLQAIDRVGDRIIDYMSQEKLQSLRDENQALRLAASQSAQNAFITANQEAQTAELIRRLGRDVPVPAYVVPNPNCCYQYSVQPTCGCNTGCGSF